MGPYVDTPSRTLADGSHQAIGGLSTGAFGAANIALLHPNMFGYVLGLSGTDLAVRPWTGKALWHGEKAVKADNRPARYAPRVSGTAWLPFCLIVGGSDNLDDTLHQTRQFDAVLAKLRVPHVADYFPGRHSWIVWRLHAVDALEYVGQGAGLNPRGDNMSPTEGASVP